MSLPIKAGIGLVTIGTVGGVGYGIVAYSQNQGTAISELIEKEYEYILLKTEGETDKTHWTTNWKAYTSNGNNVFSLDNWDNLKSGDNSSELKKKCETLSATKITNTKDSIYSNVTSYCGRRVTVADEATKNNLTILKTDSKQTGNVEDGPIWKKRHAAASVLKSELAKLKIKDTSPTEEEIRTGCDVAKSKSKKETNYQEIYKAYLKVCTKQKGDTTQ